jgi:hypothetical protein
VDDKSVTEQVAEHRTCAAIAADLRLLADALDTVPDVEITSNYVTFGIQPGGSDDEVMGRTDAISQALFGTPGKPQHMHGDTWHYNAEGCIGLVAVDIYDSIADPAQRERDAEWEKLRARVAELEAER